VLTHSAVTAGELGDGNPDKNTVSRLLGHTFLVWIHTSRLHSDSSELQNITLDHKVTVFTGRSRGERRRGKGRGGEEGKGRKEMKRKREKVKWKSIKEEREREREKEGKSQRKKKAQNQ